MNCNCIDPKDKKAKLLEDFATYTNNYETSPEVDELKMTYLDTALSVVEEYLGYELFMSEHEETHCGITGHRCYLKNIPVCEVYSVKVDGKEIPPIMYVSDEDGIIIKDYDHHHGFREWQRIYVDYSSGYREIPAIIKMTIFRIASLLMTEANGNIGLTSKSFGADNSRSFLNYTSYAKYLEPVSPFRRNLLK